jgi:hypothetical protein
VQLKVGSTAALHGARRVQSRALIGLQETKPMSKFALALALALASFAAAGQALALNPQPLPPRWISPPVGPHPTPVPHVPVVHF